MFADAVFDAILEALAAHYPHLTITEEVKLKADLLDILNSQVTDPIAVERRFKAVMDRI
jgi:hypothetical protein